MGELNFGKETETLRSGACLIDQLAAFREQVATNDLQAASSLVEATAKQEWSRSEAPPLARPAPPLAQAGFQAVPRPRSFGLSNEHLNHDAMTKRRVHLVAFAVFLISGTGLAQNTDALMTAPVFKNTLYIARDESKQIRFYGNSRDDEDMNWEHAVLRRDSLFLVRDGTFNLRYMIVNPLRYKFVVEGKTVEDKYYYQRVEDIISEVVRVTALVTNTDIGSISGVGLSPNKAEPGGGVHREGRELKAFEFMLPAWESGIRPDVEQGNEKGEEVFKKIQRLHDGELRKDLYMVLGAADGKACLQGQDAWLEPVIIADSLATYNPRDLTRFIIERALLVDITGKDAERQIMDLRDTLVVFQRKNKAFEAAIAKITDKQIKDNCQTGFTDVLYQIYNKKNDKLKRLSAHRNDLATKLTGLLDVLQQVHNKLSSTESLSLQLYSAPLSEGNLERVKLSIMERTYELNGDDKIEAKEEVVLDRTLLFRDYQLITPRIFPGLIFSDLSFNVFEAALDTSGSNVVQESIRKESFVKIGVMANFNFDIGNSKSVPFLQLGASASRERPIICLGGGFQINEHLAISAGGLFHWQQSLDGLAVGDVVTGQDVVDKDVKFLLQDPQFYFGIQIR